MFVLTVDQRSSRTTEDAVPSLRGAAPGALVGFTRTVGDEAQAVFDRAGPAVRCLVDLVLTGRWHGGLGIGGIEGTLPDDVRRARGTAFVHAREAVEAAKGTPSHLSVRSGEADGEMLEASLRVLVSVRGRQRATTREAYGLALGGASQSEIADRLGISQQAVSDRLGTGLFRELEGLMTQAALLAGRVSERLSGEDSPGIAAA